MFLHYHNVLLEILINWVLVGVIIQGCIIKPLGGWLFLLAKGIVLSDTRRAISYIHARQKHTEKLGVCVTGDCKHLATVSSQPSSQSAQQA